MRTSFLRDLPWSRERCSSWWRPVRARADSGGCLAHQPNYIEGTFEPQYTSGCTGQRPDRATRSRASSRWNVARPTRPTRPARHVLVRRHGDRPRSLFGQAFVELQFYPNAYHRRTATPNGGFMRQARAERLHRVLAGLELTSTGRSRHTSRRHSTRCCRDGELDAARCVMHAGDTITVHWFTTPALDGYHVTVTDVTTAGQRHDRPQPEEDGPLMPAFDIQKLGNALGLGPRRRRAELVRAGRSAHLAVHAPRSRSACRASRSASRTTRPRGRNVADPDQVA